MRTQLSDDGTILHIHIPMKLRRRGGKKIIITSGDTPLKSDSSIMHEDPMVRSIAKARRWQMMLENGEVATIKDLANKEGVDNSLVARTLRLNTLAPDIVELILGGDYADEINLETLRRGIPLSWVEQRVMFNLL
jgi:hypothetical protein